MRFTFVTRSVITVMMVIIFGIGGPALADSFFKQVVHTDAYEVMGKKQAEKNDTTILWLANGKACAQTANKTAVIFDAKKNIMYMLDLEKKEYSAISLNPAASGGEGDPKDDNQAQMMRRASAMMGAPKITVAPSKETKKIGDWQTKMYTIDLTMAMVASKQQMWVTEDIDTDIGAFHAVCGGMMAQMPGFGDFVEQLKQIKGVPVLTTTVASVMGQDILTTVEMIEHAEKDAPDGIYDIPEGYKEVEMNMGMGGH
ncbi:MAG: hypothetical protein GY841_01335 [FCB group bacterium]|nr:hypothetical protein [FCB group bacterium]